MAFAESLKKFRDAGYSGRSEPDDGDDEKEESSGVRTIKLTDDEAKELASYGKPGEEAVCEVSGKIEGNTLRVMSVRASGGGRPMDENADAEALMAQMRGPAA